MYTLAEISAKDFEHSSKKKKNGTKKRNLTKIHITSFPCDLRKSISSGVKLAMDIDFTLWGGFNPRLKQTKKSEKYCTLVLDIVTAFNCLNIYL